MCKLLKFILYVFVSVLGQLGQVHVLHHWLSLVNPSDMWPTIHAASSPSESVVENIGLSDRQKPTDRQTDTASWTPGRRFMDVC